MITLSKGCDLRSIPVWIAVLVFAVLVYLLSAGPVWWLVRRGVISKPAYSTIYAPIAFLDQSPGDIFYRYVDGWAPVIEIHNMQ